MRVDCVEKVVALWHGSGLALFRTEDGRTCAMGQGILAVMLTDEITLVLAGGSQLRIDMSGRRVAWRP